MPIRPRTCSAARRSWRRSCSVDGKGKKSRGGRRAATFEITRPLVGASALGIAQAAYECTLEYLDGQSEGGTPLLADPASPADACRRGDRDRAARLLVQRAPGWAATACRCAASGLDVEAQGGRRDDVGDDHLDGPGRPRRLEHRLRWRSSSATPRSTSCSRVRRRSSGWSSPACKLANTASVSVMPRKSLLRLRRRPRRSLFRRQQESRRPSPGTRVGRGEGPVSSATVPGGGRRTPSQVALQGLSSAACRAIWPRLASFAMLKTRLARAAFGGCCGGACRAALQRRRARQGSGIEARRQGSEALQGARTQGRADDDDLPLRRGSRG